MYNGPQRLWKSAFLYQKWLIQTSSAQNPIALKNGKIIAISDNEVDFSMTESINRVQTRGEGIIKINVKMIALEGTVDDLLAYASIIKKMMIV